MLKGFLSQLAVPYTLYDLNVDAEARAEFLRRGYRLPPVVVIDGVAVEGFDPERIEALILAAEQASQESDAN